MALDRFIHFKKSPLWTDLCTTVLQYFGPEVEIKFERPWIVVTLPGQESFVGHRKARQEMARQRGLEIHQNSKDRNIDVITRQADEFTNAVADGLVDLLSRMYSGKRETDQ